MGGWLRRNHLGQGGWVEGCMVLIVEKKQSKSIVVIGDRTGKIVGIFRAKKGRHCFYPSLYPGLADARLLKGVDHFGLLRVGAYASSPAIQPVLSRTKLVNYLYAHTDQKEILCFVFSKELLQRGYCEFYVCENPEDYPVGSYIHDLGGWWSSDGTREMIQKFGLDPDGGLVGCRS